MQPLQDSWRRWSNGALLKRTILLFCGWGWATAIVVLSLIPTVPSIDIEQGDKLGHFAAYGLLMFVFCLIYDQRATRLAYATGFIAMGVALEFLQGMTGYRTFDLLDMLANATGVLGVLAGMRALRFLGMRTR